MSDEQVQSAPVSETPSESQEPVAQESAQKDATAPQAADAKAAVADAKEVLADPTATKSEKKAAEKRIEKFKLKVYGRDVEESIDLNDRNAVMNKLQKAAAADRTMQESAEVRKAALALIDDLKKNPRRVLSDPSIGVDLKKFAEEILNEQLAEMEKSPEQRERDKLQKELKELKEQREKEQKESKDKEFARLQAEHERNLEIEISSALDIGGLPKTPRTVKNMAEMMMIALQNGIDLSAKDLAPVIKRNNMSEFKEIINALSDDQLEDFMGKEVIARLRKKQVAKAKTLPQTASVKATGTSETKKPAEAAPVKKQSIRDFLKV